MESGKPSRSDAHLNVEEAAKVAAATKEYFDEVAPKRHTKPQRSEHSSTYEDSLPSGDHIIPEYVEFQHLEEKDTQKLVYNGSKAAEEFSETEYYKDLNGVDKQHHTTGTGFIKVDGNDGEGFSLAPDSAPTENHESCRGNPATNDWIPSANNDMVDVITGKPNRSG